MYTLNIDKKHMKKDEGRRKHPMRRCKYKNKVDNSSTNPINNKKISDFISKII